MTPAEVVAQLREEGQEVEREEAGGILIVPGPAPGWFRAWLNSDSALLLWARTRPAASTYWPNRVPLLRHLDQLERPDSRRTIGTLPLEGADRWR